MPLDTNNNLTTLQLAKVFLGESTGSTGNDERLNALINGVSLFFNSATQRRLKRRSLTEYYDGTGRSELLLNEYPIRSGSTALEVYIADSRDDYASDADFTTSVKVLPADLAIYREEGKIHADGWIFTAGHQNIKVVYNAGYDTSALSTAPSTAQIPEDLRDAVHQLLDFNWRRAKHNRIGLISKATETESETYVTEQMPFLISEAIERYRSLRFG